MLLIICCFFQSLFAHPQKAQPETSTMFADRIKPKLVRLVQTVETLYLGCDDMIGEQITQYEHALQTADLASKELHESPTMIVAALLHDIGRVIEPHSNRAEIETYNVLSPIWGEAVARPPANLIKSKRFMLAVDAGYAVHLTPASLERVPEQGGAFAQDSPEYAAFKKDPYFEESITLRLWDDRSKDSARSTRTFQDYEKLLVDVAYENLRTRYSDSQIEEAIASIHAVDDYLKSRL